MKKYILKKWYPSLYEDIEEGIEVEYKDGWMYYVDKRGNITRIEFDPDEFMFTDFWEPSKKREPFFVTDDGVEVFSDIDNLFAVNLTYFSKTQNTLRSSKWLIDNPSYKVFSIESNADEFIWKNKLLFSYEDMRIALGSQILTNEDLIMRAKERVNGTNQEFIDNVNYDREYLKEKIDGRCPKCGGELEYSHIGRVLLSNPPQRQINCTKCSHVGYLTIERVGYE